MKRQKRSHRGNAGQHHRENSKHMRRYYAQLADKTVMALTPIRWSNRGGEPHQIGEQYPVEFKATASPPWVKRARNRRRNKVALRTRVANARRAR